jgi:Xaa-Pro aminopeptidase
MRTPLLALALLAACSSPPSATATPAPSASASGDPTIPRPISPGPLAAPIPGASAEARGLTGPRAGATLGVDVYRKRRRALMDKLGSKEHGKPPSGALVAGDMSFNGLREGMDVYYLTGVDEAGASVLLTPGAPIFTERLVVAPLDVEEGRFTGDRVLLPSRPLEVATGFAQIARASWLPHMLIHACDQYGSLAFVQDYVADPAPKPKAQELYAKTLDRTYGCQVNDLHGLLARMREVKAPEELALMRQAIAYTAAGHAAALGAIHPGAHEFEVKDAVEDAFRKAGSRHVAYDSIVGSGGNSAVLHYPKDDRVMQSGELVLIDAAAEAEYYASDVTRTMPVSGKFTREQRDIYEIVLRAQKAGIDAVRAGARVEDVDLATRKVIADAGYYDYYVHGCCHFVGLEVHDAGDYDRPLPPGAVITVEPGIYLPQRGFGVRIEDEVLVTDGTPEVLTAAIPKDPDAIEARMAEASRK